MADSIFYVYVYFDPRNGQPFYVGKGQNDRHLDHLRDAEKITESENFNKDNNQRRLHKINSIKRDGYEPIITFYSKDLTEEQAYDLEDFLILVWGRKDFDEHGILFNILESGRRSPCISGSDHYAFGKPGNMTGKKLTKRQREKVSESKLGKKREPFSAEWIKNMSESGKGEKNSMYGKKHKPESKKLMKEKALGRKQTKETIEKKNISLKKNAIERAKKYMPIVKKIIESGITTYKGIAKEMNRLGYKTERGVDFDDGRVKRLIGYMKEIEGDL